MTPTTKRKIAAARRGHHSKIPRNERAKNIKAKNERKKNMTIKITGGRKSSQQRNALRKLGIALNGQDPSYMVESGHRRHNGLVRVNPEVLEVACDLATAQSQLDQLVAADKYLAVHAPFEDLKVVEISSLASAADQPLSTHK